MLSFKVSLFIQFIQSWKQREFDYLVCSGREKKSVIEGHSLLINISYQTLQSTPLRMALFIIAMR